MDLGPGGAGAVWAVTESGNRIGIGNGFAYNAKMGGAYALDSNAAILQLRVGESAVVPGMGSTSSIKSILVSDVINHNDGGYPDSWTGRDPSAARIVNSPVDPLLDVRLIGDAVQAGAHGNPATAVEILNNDVARLQGSPVSFL